MYVLWLQRIIEDGETDWLAQWRALEASTWEATTEALNSGDDFDGAFIYDLIETLPSEAHLFVGNSLAIRHVNQFGKPSAKNIHVFGNRGASGINGNISTGLGVASQTDEPLVLLVGDITFYHDMNGLFAVKNLDLTNVTIVLMNNNGGGIFNRLPINQFEPAFTDLFIMPHDLQFEHAARLYGLDFVSTPIIARIFGGCWARASAAASRASSKSAPTFSATNCGGKEVIKAVKERLNAKRWQ